MFSEELEKIDWEETTKTIYSKTESDVLRALGKEHCDVDDLMALISPAAAKYLEPMAQLSKKYTEERFGKTISMFIPLYITNSCTNSCVYCGFHISNPMARTILTPEQIEDEYTQVTSFDEQADDYITKPFKLAIFLSRLNALLRRSENFNTEVTELTSNDISIRLLKGEVYKQGKLLELTASEYKLLCFFMENPDQVLSAEQILGKLWDCNENYIDNNSLTVYIRRLRTKIEDNPGEPKRIVTVRGMGYKWNTVD